MEFSPRFWKRLKCLGVVFFIILFLVTLIFLGVGVKHEIDIGRPAPSGGMSSTVILVFLILSLFTHLLMALLLWISATEGLGHYERHNECTCGILSIYGTLFVLAAVGSMIAAIVIQVTTFGWVPTSLLQGLVLFYAYVPVGLAVVVGTCVFGGLVCYLAATVLYHCVKWLYNDSCAFCWRACYLPCVNIWCAPSSESPPPAQSTVPSVTITILDEPGQSYQNATKPASPTAPTQSVVTGITSLAPPSDVSMMYGLEILGTEQRADCSICNK